MFDQSNRPRAKKKYTKKLNTSSNVVMILQRNEEQQAQSVA